MSTAEVITLNHESNLMSNVKKGHIVLHRSINNSEWSDDAVMFSLWAKLLCMASYKDRLHSFDGKDWYLKTGQLVTTYTILGRMVKINNQPCDKELIRRIVRFFKSKDMLSTEKSGNSVIVTIKNYTQYQSDFFAAPKTAPEIAPQAAQESSNNNALEVVKNSPKTAPKTAPEIAQNNTLLNNTLNNNKTHMSSDNDLKAKNDNKNSIDFELIMNAYNDAVDGYFPKIDKINTKRKNLINKFFKENKKLSQQDLINYFYDFAEQAPNWVRGENNRGWKAKFEFIIKDETYTQFLEGSL